MSMARSWIGSLAFCCILISVFQANAACVEPRWSDAIIVKMGREPVLDDGRVIRLAGLTILQSDPPLPLGPMKVSVLTPTPDRWGRVAAFVTTRQFTDSFNVRALREGAALALPSEWPRSCFAVAHVAEQEARQAQRGLWAQSPVVPVDDLEGLKERIGRFTIVEGQVRAVRQGRRQIFLNFGAFSRDRLSVSVALSRVDAFKAAGIDLLALGGQYVSLRGVVGPGPSMELNMPEALFVAPRQ